MPIQNSGRWTEAEISILRQLYPVSATYEIANRLSRSLSSVREKAKALKIRKIEHSGLFSKHHRPLSPRCEKTQPVGAEISHHGYRLWKINDTGNWSSDWEYANRVVWTAAYGPIPEGCYVIFRDGNKNNIDLENLALVSKAEKCRHGAAVFRSYPLELRQAMRALGKLKRIISERS